MRTLGRAPEAESGVATLVRVAIELRGIPVGDPLRQAAAVPLGTRRLGDQLVPVTGVRREDPPVAHDEGDAGRVEAVFEQLEGPAEVPLPAVGVPGEQQVERAGPRLGEHLRHRRRAPDGGPAVGDLEHEPGVDEAVAVDEAVLLLALAGRGEAVVLARGRLTDPAGDP
ncbi:MAG TPA: hypothetical protein VFR93_02960 [Candidatus Limnocylindrales bacterium]|nr:hypothetical protein [Candidatus Limnocylindrales bacterium]